MKESTRGSHVVISMTSNGKNDRKNLVLQLESDILVHSRITKLSYRTDPSYFAGRAGIIRILNLVLGGIAIALLVTGYKPSELESNEETDELIRQMGTNKFSGYGASTYTICSMALGGSCAAVSLIFITLLFMFMEVRCDLLWEKVNQKVHVVGCILSVSAAFCDVLSIQEIQMKNCKTTRCNEEVDNTKITKYEEEFYPPFFFLHYTAFVLFLTNAMLYSIASRIWLRNED